MIDCRSTCTTLASVQANFVRLLARSLSNVATIDNISSIDVISSISLKHITYAVILIIMRIKSCTILENETRLYDIQLA